MNPPVNMQSVPASTGWGIRLVLVALLFLIAGCNVDFLPAEDSPEPDAEPTATPGEEAEEGGSLIVALPEEPESLNFSLTSSASAHWILSTIDARMIQINSDNELEPQLLREVPSLENGGISEDGLTYTIRFLPDLTWSDGEPLDARDFRFTWETLTTGDYPATSQPGWSMIEDVTVSEDNLSAVIRLRNPSAGFINRVLAGGSGQGAGFLLPRHQLDETSPEDIAAHPYGDEEHIGSGPFEVVEWEPGEQLTVERNDAYWDEPPLLDRIVFRFTESPRDAISQVTTGDVDLSVSLPETTLLDAIETEETESYVTPRAGAVKTYAFNLNDPENLDAPHPIFQDRSVRQAILMGFDRWRVVEEILLDQSDVPATPLSNTRWENEMLSPIPYDPERAAALLDEAGWVLRDDGYRYRGNTQLQFGVTTVSGEDQGATLRGRVQNAFIEDMAELGIEVQPENYEPAQMFGTDEEPGILAERNFDIIDIPWDDRSSLDTFVERFGEAFIPSSDFPEGGNLMGYTNDEVNQLIREQGMTLDPAERARILNDVQQIVMGDIPVILIYDHIEVDVARSYVHGLDPGPVSGLWWNVDEWWVSTEEVLSQVE